MIRVRKPELAPDILRDRGALLTAALCSQVEAGQPPSFDRDVYGAAEVKQALCTAQHDKCCFCESKLTHAQFGDVEHFRPKARTQQGPDSAPSTGYYWLAYDWDNLYLSCEVCNRRHKRGLFPLANPDQRVSSHGRSAHLGAEQPLFVDPGREDPETVIEFRREYAVAISGNERGRATLDALQLDRPALLQRRRERRQPLVAIVGLLRAAARRGLPQDDHDVAQALDAVINATADNAEYAAMTRSLLRDTAHWAPDTGTPASLLQALRTQTDDSPAAPTR